MEIKVFKENEKVLEAFEKLAEYLDELVEKYHLTYIEVWEIIGALTCEITKRNIVQEEKEDGE